MNASSKSLYSAAKKARLRSYSPYSGHQVGAAIRLKNGKVYSGANVENSSYGGTVCAERVAIWKAVTEEGKPISIAEVCVVTDAKRAWPPCGLCRQVIAEFASPKTRVISVNLQGKSEESTFEVLMPHAFTPGYLLK